MARKGNQSKSGPNHASPKWKNTTDGDALSTPERGAADSENPSSHVQGRSKGPEGSSEKKGRGSKRNSTNNGISSSGKKQQMDTSCDISSSEEKEIPVRGTKNRRGSQKPSRRGFGRSFLIEQTTSSGLAGNVLEKTRCIACMAASIIRASMIYLVEEGKRFIEKRMPTINTYMAFVNKGHAYVLSKIAYVYPIVRAWMLNAGRVMLLLFTVWLDCNVRGFDSLLRLGTNSLLAVLWCSTLSTFAMIGIKKMLIFMVWFKYPLGFCSNLLTMPMCTSLIYDISPSYTIHASRYYMERSTMTFLFFHIFQYRSFFSRTRKRAAHLYIREREKKKDLHPRLHQKG
jgi:DnaJ homolog subfamily C member 14